jgi:arylsulfatase A-like enzyme
VFNMKLALPLLLLAALASPAGAAGPRWNVVLVLVDDLGWTDFACCGSDLYRTPHIDRLAREGVRFTSAYSACCVCSPTRAAILTGKYPARLHVTDWIPGLPPANPRLLEPDWTKHLPAEEITLARALKDAGYATACVGKWHLGGPDYYPERFGFDRNVGGTDKPSTKTYFAPWNIATLSEGKPGEYLTDRLGDEAVKFIAANKDRPFFLYLSHFGVHTPIQGPPELVKQYRARLRPESRHRNPAYAAMVERVDATVGQVRAKLAELGLADHTLVVVASDNGGRLPTTSNKPLRAGKGGCYEGGVRVPLIVYWPGVTRAATTCDVPTISMDLYPTILEAVGVAVPARQRPDGVSLVPLLRRTGGLTRDALYWHYPHYQLYQKEGTTPYSAIRAGDFKLIEYLADNHVELYDLKADGGERHDLAATQPGRAKALRAKLHAWRKQVGAQLPARNPRYDPTKPEHVPKKK